MKEVKVFCSPAASTCFSLWRKEHTLALKTYTSVFESQEGYVTAKLQACHSHQRVGGQQPLELCSEWLSGSKCPLESQYF